MNFADEEYVRLYVADTVTWELLGWEGQALLALALRKFDRSGVLEFGRHGAEKALQVATGIPAQIVKEGLERLLAEEVWVLLDDRIFWPKYIDAQTCKRSDRVRQRASRARNSQVANGAQCDKPSRSVTGRHEIDEDVTNVTKCHPRRGKARQGSDLDLRTLSDLGGSDAREPDPPVEPSPLSTAVPKCAVKFAASFDSEAPEELVFTPEHREYAKHHGLDLAETWLACRDYRRARRYRCANWDAEFMSWLRREVKLRRDSSRPKGVKAPRQPNGGGFGAEFLSAASKS